MPIPQFISQIFDFLEDLASFRRRLFPSADRGLGTIHISADTAIDGRAPGATDLVAVAGHYLSVSFPSYDRFREGSTITLVPPPGFRFVDDLPGVEVGAIARYFDADSPNVHSLPGIPGNTILTGDGRIIWEAREAPSQRYLEQGPLLVTFGKDKPLWIQPESGVDAEEKGGWITLETTAVFSGAYTISYGLGEIVMDPGIVSLTQSLVEADPPGIRGDGADSSELVVLTLDDFGNPTERGVASVELVRNPELGDLSAPLTYLEPGLRRTWLSALMPSGEMIVSALLNGMETISGRQFRIHGVDLGITLEASETTPAVGDDLEVTCRLSNDSDVPANGVSVNFGLDPDLDLSLVLQTGGATVEETSPGRWGWTDLDIPANGETELAFLITVLRETGTGMLVTASLTASQVGDQGGAHTGTGRSDSVEFMPIA